MPFNELRAITAFAKAIELGSIRKAALAQGITPQAASHTIAQLERHLCSACHGPEGRQYEIFATLPEHRNASRAASMPRMVWN